MAKQPAERPGAVEVLQFLNKQSGFPDRASMPLPIFSAAAASQPGTGSGLRAIPLAEEKTLANTLSRAPAQIPAGTARNSRRLFLGVALLGTSLLGAGLFVREHYLRKEIPAVTVANLVSFSISSTPSGAEVIRASDQRPLGHTPFHYEMVRGKGEESLLLRLPGYEDLPVNLGEQTAQELSLKLTPKAASPSPSGVTSATGDRPSAGTPQGGNRRKKDAGKASDKRRSTVTNNDIELIK